MQDTSWKAGKNYINYTPYLITTNPATYRNFVV